MRILYGAVLTLIVIAAGGVAIVYSGVYNIAASNNHTALGKWVMHTTMHNSVKASAGNITAPVLNDGNLIKQGASAYDSLCVACHLKPGLEDSVLRAGLNPRPPNLTEQGHWEPEEQFWIIKHGIKMTGMPAWGKTHEDQELWEIVAFLQRLPGLSEQEYREMVQLTESSRKSPDDDGHDHEHGNMGGMIKEPSSTIDQQGDGRAQDYESLSGMEGATTSKNQDETSDNASSDSTREAAKPDDHYADGHTH